MHGTSARIAPHMLLLVVSLACTSCRSDVFSEPEPWQIDEETSCLPWEAEHEGSCINIPPQGKYKSTLEQVKSNCSAVPDEWREILFTLNSTVGISFRFDRYYNQKLDNLKTYSPLPAPRIFPYWATSAGSAQLKKDKITLKQTKDTNTLTIKTTLSHDIKNEETKATIDLTFSEKTDSNAHPFQPKTTCKETYEYSLKLLEECPFHCQSRVEPPEGYELYPEQNGSEDFPNGPTPNHYWPEPVHICFCVER